MKLAPETDPLPRLLAFPYATITAIMAAVFLIYGRSIEQIAFCPLRRLTGCPCPTCGGTHAAMALLRGDLPAAIALNPLVATAALILALWLTYAIGATLRPAWRRRIVMGTRARKIVRLSIVSVIMLSWILQCCRCL
jgi:hypothetical protein